MELSDQIVEMKNALIGQIGEFKEQLDGVKDDARKIHTQVDAIDASTQERVRQAGGSSDDPAKEIARKLIEQKSDFERFKRLRFEVKSTLLSTGLTTPQATTEVGLYDAFPYGPVRRLFRTVPATTGSVFQLEEDSNTGWTTTSPQTEGGLKSEATMDLSTRILNVSTIASWIRLSSQALDDVKGLEAYIRSRLLWALAKTVDDQIVAGSGVGVYLRGLVPAAVSFNTGILSAASGYDRASVIGAAAAQIRIAGFTPTFALLHPIDSYRMRFQRDSTGQYVNIPSSLPPIVETVSLSQGTFVVGDSSRALIRPRHEAIIEMSSEDGDNFRLNLLTVRAEERLLFQILSNRAFVTGSLTTSPAS